MPEKQKQTNLLWFRNNLRIQDNISLSKALIDRVPTLAVYCFDPRHFKTDRFGFQKTAAFRAKFLIESVLDLKQNLKALGIELFVFHAYPEDRIPNLISQHNVTSIFYQNEWTPEETQVTKAVKQKIKTTVLFHEHYDQFLYHPSAINMEVSKIPQVFTLFRKHVEKQSKVRLVTPHPTALAQTSLENTTTVPNLEDLGFQDFEVPKSTAFPFKGGETAALQRLDHYFFKTKKLGVYKKTRNGLLGTDYSSKFSPWLANGCISAKTLYQQVKTFEKTHYKNQSTYWLIFELIWRDYFKYISLKHGNAIFKLEGIRNTSYEWQDNKALIDKWINGETQSAFVNANMIELKTTGWMSNRGRQNVASYFSKALQLDWRIGAAYFESLLLDYDVHSNYGNWMYVSGVGNDPRDRKFNVNLQAQRYDGQGKFQKLWLQPSLF
jgi:deoxyribodipyrimidine photo-lyase